MAITRLGGANAITGTIPQGNIANASLGAVTALPAAIATGKVLQVLSTAKTSGFGTTSSSLTDITGLSVAITPSSSSNKIFITAYINGLVDASSQAYGGRYQLVRGSTEIGKADASGSKQLGTGSPGGFDGNPFTANTTINFLDSPSSTSELTYKIQVAHTQSQTIRVNEAKNNPNDATFGLKTISTITAYEIAG